MVKLAVFVEEALGEAREAALGIAAACPLLSYGPMRAVSGDRPVRQILREESGQGTTEYAILVGVLVVIAILAIVAFRDKVSSLWEAISQGINSL